MSTLVRTTTTNRQPLQALGSMTTNHQAGAGAGAHQQQQPQGRRHSKRLAAMYDEADGDFHFTRGGGAASGAAAKRQKTAATAGTQQTQQQQENRNSADAAGAPERRVQKKSRVAPAVVVEEEQQRPTTTLTATTAAARRPGRRKSSPEPARATAKDASTTRGLPPKERDEAGSGLAVPKQRHAAAVTKRKTRNSTEQVGPGGDETSREVNGGGATGPDADVEDALQQPPPDSPATPDRAPPGKATTSRMIALPFSDTPVIVRNKEFRKKGGLGSSNSSLDPTTTAASSSSTTSSAGQENRRSSLGMRGRRASSLLAQGQSALPHRTVEPAEFHKHIEASGALPEPRRMRQLLVWCGERALTPRPPMGEREASARLGARAIQDQLLKDFAARSEFSDWFAREDDAGRGADGGGVDEGERRQQQQQQRQAEQEQRQAALKPNPRNVEYDEKIAVLEARIKRLKEERKSWLAIKRAPPEIPPLFPAATAQDKTQPPPRQATPSAAHPLPLPDLSLLSPSDASILKSLSQPAAAAAAAAAAASKAPPPASSTALSTPAAFALLASTTTSRLLALQSRLELSVDVLAQGVHVLSRRVAAGQREADAVLALSADRLGERDERERRLAGTNKLPVAEVLRGLGRALNRAEDDAGEAGS